MKRKRGNKKAKRKQLPSTATANAKETVSLITQDNSGLEELDHDSAMEIDTPSSNGGTDHNNVAPNDSSIEKPSLGRVKVKLLRTSKMMDTHLNSSTQSQSDTDKSSLQMGLEKHALISDKIEDSANSFPQRDTVVSLSKKPGIKIKSSKSYASKAQAQIQMPRPDSRLDKKELESALMVIKKIMKMEAAEPFNVPVNPIALGIPDYFDVIDTPMDFGTICNNLENGVKYMNSEDVFNDVKYIWENCYKYNNKGDYILDLMRRVKKNFSKYWSAAGLYNGQVTATNGIEILQENGGTSSQVKLPPKGGQSKQKAGKRHGRRHKSDCLCAICVLKRRRKEREDIARIAKDQIGVDNNITQEFKAEESQHVESLCSEDSSSNADDSLDNLDVEEEMEDGAKMEVSKPQCSTPDEKQEEGEEEEEGGNEMELKTGGDDEGSEQCERLREDPSRPSKSTSIAPSADAKVEDVVWNEEGQQAIHKPEHKELQEKRKKMVKAWEELNSKNPMVLELCGILFPANPRSVWTGPHSLLHQSKRTSSVSSIHTAIDKFMN